MKKFFRAYGDALRTCFSFVWFLVWLGVFLLPLSAFNLIEADPHPILSGILALLALVAQLLDLFHADLDRLVDFFTHRISPARPSGRTPLIDASAHAL